MKLTIFYLYYQGALLPFEIAFKNKNVAMMKLLLDYGVDVNLIPPRVRVVFIECLFALGLDSLFIKDILKLYISILFF